jgi:hypothetical protein
MLKEDAAAILVSEKNGHLPASIQHEIPGRTELTIVAQGEGESPAAFAARVARCMTLRHSAQRPSIAVVCCGDGGDDASWNARTSVAASLLSTMDETGQLTISADPTTGLRSLPRFFELLETLCRRGLAGQNNVHLRFDPGGWIADRDGELWRMTRDAAPEWRLTA